MIQFLKFPFLLLILFTYNLFGQDKRVLVTEKTNGKRTVLIAENTTIDSLDIFLMLNADGYRKSTSQEKIINLPPKSKTNLITLIELKNVPSKFTYELFITERKTSMTYVKGTIDIESTVKDKLVIFTEEDCDRCKILDKALIAERIPFRNLDIGEDPVLYEQFIAFVQKRFPKKEKIRLPAIWNKDHVIFGFDELPKILDVLRN